MSKKDCDRRYYEKHKERVKARTNAYYHANSEAALAQQKVWREDNAGIVRGNNRAWAAAYPEKMLGYHLAYVKRNRDKWTAQTAARRAAQRGATPAWNNAFFVGEAYALAAQRTAATGVKWHVDHIVPLVSKRVCGLHAHTNIAVVLAKENRVKSNRHWPSMP